MAAIEERSDVGAAIARRRAAAAEAWDLRSEIVLVGAGEQIGIPGRADMTYPFIAHSEYFYLTDENGPSGVLAFDPAEGWVHFRAPVTDSDRLWAGVPEPDAAAPTSDALGEWLASRAGRHVAALGSPPARVESDARLSGRLRAQLSRVRRRKDEVELARMRRAADATSAGFASALACLRPGITERDVQIELEAATFRAGADRMAFDTIVGGGPNSAVLHFAPTRRPLVDGELVLIDAGGEYHGYASDVTRTYPVGGAFGSEQREIYLVVQEAQRAALASCRPGIEWREVHLAASLSIAEGLASIGLLDGRPESLVESGAISMFFPHGIGHLLGLGPRDAGGVLPERQDDPPPFPNLRINLPLERGMVVTIEPGVYFVPALLRDADRRRRHRDEVAWERVDRMLGFGGVRIEDNALVTEVGYELLTREIPQPSP